jgi:hypothetical protein
VRVHVFYLFYILIQSFSWPISASFRQNSRIHESSTDKRKVFTIPTLIPTNVIPCFNQSTIYFEQTTAWRIGRRSCFYARTLCWLLLRQKDGRYGCTWIVRDCRWTWKAAAVVWSRKFAGEIGMVWRRENEGDVACLSELSGHLCHSFTMFKLHLFLRKMDVYVPSTSNICNQLHSDSCVTLLLILSSYVRLS